MKRAIIIIDHGSWKQEANQTLEELANLVREKTEDVVYTAHMEYAKPSLDEAFNAAVADGAEFIFIFPYFLAPGQHSTQDIPQMCVRAAQKHPHLEWHCTHAIGTDSIMADLILQRFARCEASEFICDDCPDSTKCQPPEDDPIL